MASLFKLDQFIYLGRNISSMESNVNILIGKAWAAMDKLTTIGNSDLSGQMKQDCFQAVVVSVLYGCTTWTGKKLNGNSARMLHTVSNKSWKQHFSKQQLYGHLPPILQTILERWARHSEHCWGSKDKLRSDVLLPTKIYIHQLYTDTGCCQEDLPKAMANKDG